MASPATLRFALLSCLITSLSSPTASKILSPKPDKVSLELYYESLCPFCSNFIVNYLNDFVHDKDFLSIVNLHLSPWGNARIRPDGSFWCQHGEYECLLDTVEACAIDVWPKLEEHFPFIYCVESLVYEDKEKEWKSCFEKLGLDPKPVIDCTYNGHGKELELKYAAETNALQPRKRYVPWVVVDGQPLYEDYGNFTSYICKAYKGADVPKACSQLSNYETLRRESKAPVCYEETMTSTFSGCIKSAITLMKRQMGWA